ncbi:MAG TPA: magnesium transporter CorA family protein [Saprospiraceae bacterium]|nr:magnesium transporter CorA family protein [Saprospiraceae bacterium]HRG22537.1 magnesium transporter CorA family protein [Saprospiraceae bacterium]
MIYCFRKDKGELTELTDPREAVWINLYPPFEHGELDRVAAALEIPLDFLTDSLDVDERSRYEKDEDTLLILVSSPVLNDDDRENEAIYLTIPIGIVLTQDKILTISSQENPILEKFMEDKVKNFDPNDAKMFVLQIFEQNVYRFLECLKKLNLKRNLIEQVLYNSSRNEELQQLLRIEKSLVYFVNSLNANELLKLKLKRTDLLKLNDLESHADLFEDIIIDNGQALGMSNVYTNILSGTMEAYASIVSNNMNIFIHRLTLITIILMVPTLVASFYGMNLSYLPFQDSKWAFPIIIIISLILGYGLIWFFRSRQRI